MNSLLRIVALSGLLMMAAAAAHAAGQGRGDHDTPATERNSRGFQSLGSVRDCRNDGGWVVCRDARGQWRRHRDDSWLDDCRGDDDWPCAARRVLPRNVVIDWLRGRDFVDLRDMRLGDDVYTVKAVDPHGRRVRLTIDAFDGKILRSERR